ncbi:hypothetical protein HPB48_001158 [Haemaphysalis longicornis]|uniref:Uncharacterized protein n=1 Tax=Haemaphysalis longicornis TaxID=44386 RepID=A0A9J6FK30_HAELO|nr:hypothetical protein HPB48_001158 [Haemaphysalis longicornis]
MPRGVQAAVTRQPLGFARPEAWRNPTRQTVGRGGRLARGPSVGAHVDRATFTVQAEDHDLGVCHWWLEIELKASEKVATAPRPAITGRRPEQRPCQADYIRRRREMRALGLRQCAKSFPLWLCLSPRPAANLRAAGALRVRV